MKILIILFTSIIMAGCSGTDEGSTETPPVHDFPEVGQSVRSVERRFGLEYFSFNTAQGEEVRGYEFYPEIGKLAAFQPHIDYSSFVKKVVLLYVSDGRVSKVQIIDGGVTYDMLDGSAFK